MTPEEFIVSEDDGVGARRQILWRHRDAVGVFAACVACGFRSPTYTLNRYSKETALEATARIAIRHNEDCEAIKSRQHKQMSIGD